MKGFIIPEGGHVVNILPPLDINGSARVSDYFSMKNYGHVDIIIQAGVTGAASTVTVEKSTNSSGGATAAIGFKYYAETTDAGDTLAAAATATTAGFATSTNNNIMYVISIDASELTAVDGTEYPWLVVKFSNPGVSTIASAVAVLSGSRYQKYTTPTAIE